MVRVSPFLAVAVFCLCLVVLIPPTCLIHCNCEILGCLICSIFVHGYATVVLRQLISLSKIDVLGFVCGV